MSLTDSINDSLKDFLLLDGKRLALEDTSDLWDIWSEWWRNMTLPTFWQFFCWQFMTFFWQYCQILTNLTIYANKHTSSGIAIKFVEQTWNSPFHVPFGKLKVKWQIWVHYEEVHFRIWNKSSGIRMRKLSKIVNWWVFESGECLLEIVLNIWLISLSPT